jgi:hypothetical protein
MTIPNGEGRCSVRLAPDGSCPTGLPWSKRQLVIVDGITAPIADCSDLVIVPT